jgi:Dynein light chain type 1
VVVRQRFTMSEQRKAVIKNADMSDQMQQDAVDIASKALSEYSIEKVRFTVASLLKKIAVFLIFSIVFVDLPNRMSPHTLRRNLIGSMGQHGMNSELHRIECFT